MSDETTTPQLPPIEPTPVKPGVATSEFWLTLAVTAGVVFKMFGLDIDQASVEGLITGLGLVITNALVIWRYFKTRETVKTAAIKATATVAAAQPLKAQQPLG